MGKGLFHPLNGMANVKKKNQNLLTLISARELMVLTVWTSN
jgi:hypothetical protein